MSSSHRDHYWNDHDNGNGSGNSNKGVLRRLYVATALCMTFLTVEVIGGYLSGSLAILSDAAHLFADLASFAVAIIAAHLAALPSSTQHTYGLKRTESLAAMITMVALALVSIGLAWEAIRRLFFEPPQEVNGPLMSGVAAIGVVVNLILAAVLGEHHTHLPGAHGGHDHSHDHGHEGDRDHHGCSPNGNVHGHDHDHGHDHHQEKKDHDNHDHDHEHDSHDDHDHDHDDHDEHDDYEHGHEHEHEHEHDDHDDHSHDDHDHEHEHEHEHNHHHDNHDSGHHAGKSTVSTSLKTGIEAMEAGETTPLVIHQNEATPKVEAEQERRNVNLRAAYIHVLGDLAQSTAVLIAGLIIWVKPTWHIVDPIATLIFCAIVFYATLPIIRSSVAILLEEVPPNINWKTVHDDLEAHPQVVAIHDLHIWSISDGVPGLSAHCFVSGDDPNQVLRDLYVICARAGITHATIQIQHTSTANRRNTSAADCITCSGTVDPTCVRRSFVM